MKHLTEILVAVALSASLWPLQAQSLDQKCNSLDNAAALQFVPDWVPLESEVIPIDTGNLSAVRFPDRSRVAIAPLRTSSYSRVIQDKYQFILVSETRLMVEEVIIPSGLTGLSLEPEPGTEGPACTLVARDFTGREISRIGMQADNTRQPSRVSIVPGEQGGFVIRFGAYKVEGRQR